MSTDSPSNNFRSSHPEQGEQGEFYKWVKASERLPELEDKKAKSRFVHVEMKRYDSKETYIVKRTAIYFPEHFKTIEWEDWEDYSEERFPYTENDKEKGCVWLRPGWYETIHCDNCDDYWSSPLNVVEWLCKLSSPPPEGQDDPVAFVKWIGCKFFYDDESELWETIPEGKTYDFNGQKQFRFTSEELYQLFKTQKDFIGDPDECTGAFEGQ